MPLLTSSIEELRPLTALCRTGRLFEVEAWVRQGKPIALTEGVLSRSKHHHPLLVAMTSGFHSMVEVLVKAGAPTSHRGYSALAHAIELGRTDLAQLLLKHGADPSEVSMCSVIEHGCRPEVVDLFLAAGKNLTDEEPIAWGLINCIHPTLGLLKRFVVKQPELMSQLNTALRYHARKGNEKWVALTLWAGGDPLARGPDDLLMLPDVRRVLVVLSSIPLAARSEMLLVTKPKPQSGDDYRFDAALDLDLEQASMLNTLSFTKRQSDVKFTLPTDTVTHVWRSAAGRWTIQASVMLVGRELLAVPVSPDALQIRV